MIDPSMPAQNAFSSSRWFAFGKLLCAVAFLTGCHRSAPDEPTLSSATPDSVPRTAASITPLDDSSFRFAAADRVVAIGDLHGDLEAARRALRLAGAVDANDKWIGGKLVVVQTGDELDRGDQDRNILDLFDRLSVEAKAAGGAVHALNGNHETMNVAGDFRYVTAGGFEEFAGMTCERVPNPMLQSCPEVARGRLSAFYPGGTYALKLAERPVVIVVGDTVFVHGGVTPQYAQYGMARINQETRSWMRGEIEHPPSAIVDPEGPVWTRRYSETSRDADCASLGQALDALHVTRMVVAHTPQMHGITSACGDRVYRIDTGLSHYYGGPVEVLEIAKGRAHPLRNGMVGKN